MYTHVIVGVDGRPGGKTGLPSPGPWLSQKPPATAPRYRACLGPLRRLALGSTGAYLARHAQCPLLIAPVSGDASVRRWQARARVAG